MNVDELTKMISINDWYLKFLFSNKLTVEYDTSKQSCLIKLYIYCIFFDNTKMFAIRHVTYDRRNNKFNFFKKMLDSLISNISNIDIQAMYNTYSDNFNNSLIISKRKFIKEFPKFSDDVMGNNSIRIISMVLNVTIENANIELNVSKFINKFNTDLNNKIIDGN